MKTHTHTHQFDLEELKTENLLSPSKEVVKLLMKSEPFGNWRYDVATQEVWWSPTVYAIHGLKPGRGPVDINTAISAYHPDDAISVSLLIDHAIENKKGYDCILRLSQSGGDMKFVHSIASVETNTAGKVTAVFGIFKDVTDRISEHRAANMNKQLVHSIIANSPTPLVILDQDLNYLHISPSWLEFHGFGALHEFESTSHYQAFPNVPDHWKLEHQRALKGEVIHRKASAHADLADDFRGYGSVIFPWRNASKKIGGLVMMVTSDGKSKAEHMAAASQIAGLFGHSERDIVH